MHDTMTATAGSGLRHTMDEGPWTAFQKRVVALTILTVVLDGFDTQLIGVAVPRLMAAWNVGREAFVPVIGLGLAAMSLGTAIAGVLADRIGRRWSLIGSILLFGTATLATTLTNSIESFTAARLIAALGMGGALPSAVAMLSEFTPRRRRTLAVTAGMICSPLGGVLSGLAAAVLAGQPWQALFLMGGLMPLACAVALLLFLPESPNYLARRPDRAAELEKFAQRLNTHVDPIEPGREITKASYAALFNPDLRRETILLWICFLSSLTAIFCVFNWLPTLLIKLGAGVALSSSGHAMFNFGGIVGALLGAILIDRMGSRIIMLGYATLAAACTLILGIAFSLGAGTTATLVGLFVTAMFLVGTQPLLFALAAHVYPGSVRATGVGAALAIGRIGAIFSAVLGSILIGMGALPFFGFLTVMMLVVLAALATIRGHVPPGVGTPIANIH